MCYLITESIRRNRSKISKKKLGQSYSSMAWNRWFLVQSELPFLPLSPFCACSTLMYDRKMRHLIPISLPIACSWQNFEYLLSDIWTNYRSVQDALHVRQVYAVTDLAIKVQRKCSWFTDLLILWGICIIYDNRERRKNSLGATLPCEPRCTNMTSPTLSPITKISLSQACKSWFSGSYIFECSSF